MIEIKNVMKKYGDNIALKNISFNVNDGEIFAFIGHNGAGKTTLIKSEVPQNKRERVQLLNKREFIISLLFLLLIVPCYKNFVLVF